MTTSTTISGIYIDYSAYVWAYGHSPRGKGGWVFYLGDEDEPRFYQGTFSQAKKLAVNDAKTAGYWKIKISA